MSNISDIYKRSVLLNTPDSIRDGMLKPMAKFTDSYCAAISNIGNLTWDSRTVCYKYPHSFVYHLLNSPKLYDLKDISIDGGFCTYAYANFRDAEFRKNPAYKERYEPEDIKHSFQTTFFDTRKVPVGGIGFIRKKDQPYSLADFRESERYTPYIYYAYSKYIWLSKLNFFDFSSIDNSYYNGVLVVNDRCELVYANEIGKIILKESGVLCSDGELMPEGILREADFLNKVAHGNAPGCFYLNNISSILGENRFSVYRLEKNHHGSIKYKGSGYLVVFDIEKNSVKLYLKLTKRERDVLSFMALGKQDKEIAAGLGISIKTVQNHLDNIYKKLQVSNRIEALRLSKSLEIY